MIKSIKIIYKKYIEYALSKKCPVMISRSGEKGKRVNCYSIAIDKENQPCYLVKSLVDDELTCLQWDGNSYSNECKVAFSIIKPKDFRISHYYGLSEVTFFGINDFILGRLFFIEYIKIHLYRILTATNQYVFNKKKLFTKQRIKLLRVLFDLRLEGEKKFHVFRLMTELYTVKWLNHPDGNSQIQKVEFYLNALVDTGELKKTEGGTYELTGLAIRAIEDYEEQERKHVENVKIQRRMFWLTLVIVLLTLVQAGLIKLPPIIDLTAKP
ncbi:MAG: hypothetical protein JW764_00590 [Chlorobiaceae bacterium]|nr:hypothetical protein [Chlorobiaceae bacterium]